MKQKTLLLLGGSRQQIPAIECAKRLGHRTILCDYLRNNPGQHNADKYYEASTTDFEAILRVAKLEKVDGVVAYASDPAAPTAAFVAEKMGLPGQPYESVCILTDKERYRSFLARNGFFTPKAVGFGSVEEAREALSDFRLPVIIKPSDSCGSKGVALIANPRDLNTRVSRAQMHARNNRFIVEEYIQKKGYQVAGDGFSVDGKLVFRCFGNDHFNLKNENPFVPVAASFPSAHSAQIQNKIHSETQRVLDLLGLKTGAYNFDILIDADDRIYLMEIGPRNGGNYIPQVIQYATGIDMVNATIKGALGDSPGNIEMRPCKGFWGYYSTHSLRKGILKEIIIDKTMEENNVIETHFQYQPGDVICKYNQSSHTLGIMILTFKNLKSMLCSLDNPGDWISIDIKGV